MTLGEKLRFARLEAGLSQRQLCGDFLTRNMLSQIEHGTARPSLDTLQYLAGQLGKSVSFFLDEDVLTTPNRSIMEKARDALRKQNWEALEQALEQYRTPDAVFDEEWKLLRLRFLLHKAQRALDSEKQPYALRLLEQAGEAAGEALYADEGIRRKILLLESHAEPEKALEICAKLPSLDEELLLRAEAALAQGQWKRSGDLLEAVEDQSLSRWHFLRGEAYLQQGDYQAALVCFRKAETSYGAAVYERIERCCRELGDYRQAYEYACRRREKQ